MPLHTKKQTPEDKRHKVKIGLGILGERDGRNLNQRDFASKVETAQQTISKYERGEVPDSWLFLGNLHDVFGMDLNKLLKRDLTEKDVAELMNRYRDLDFL